MQFKKSTLLVFLTLLLVVCANTIVITNPAKPDPGHTGAPGEFTCANSSCHSGTAAATSGIIFNTVGPSNGLVNGYNPGQQYNLIVNVASLISPATSNTKDGFQITVLDANDDFAGNFTLSNPSLTTLDTTFGRQYVAHKDVMAGNTPAWTFRWTAPAAGTGSVTFYVATNRSNNDGTSGGDNIYIQSFTITEGTSNPCVNFNAFITTPGSANSFCSGQSLDLTAGSSSGPGSPTYQWSTSGTSQTINVNSAGTYTVTVTEGACSATASLAVTSITGGVANFSTTVSDNVVTINNNSTGVTGNYTWDFGDGTELNDNSASFSYTYDSLGTYTIEVTYTDVCGDVQTTSQNVTITTLVGVGQPSLAEVLRIYPNPFGSQASVQVNGFNGATYQFTLVDITGRIVRSLEGIGGQPLVVDRDGLQSGMYFYNILVQGQSAQGKLLVD